MGYIHDIAFKPIHQHLLVKATIKNPIQNPEEAKQMLVDLVKELGMVPVTTPQAVYIDALGNEGLTGSINLATSHIAFHVWDNDKLLMMDVYSCKDFDNHKVVDFIRNKFGGFWQLEAVAMDRETLEETYKILEVDFNRP